MLEFHSPMLESLRAPQHEHDEDSSNNNNEDDEEEDSSSPALSPALSLTPRSRFSERCRNRLLQRKFKAKAATAGKHHRVKDAAAVQRRGSSAIARVWDTLATVRWSNNKSPVVNEDVLIAKLEQLRSAAEAGLRNDGGWIWLIFPGGEEDFAIIYRLIFIFSRLLKQNCVG